MLYSSTCEYAIRALVHLAQQAPGERRALAEIADAQDLPRPFLGKILHRLARAGLLESSRGPGGGYSLARAPGAIALLEVKAAIDGTADLERCAVGLDPCTDDTPCPLHDGYKPLREAIRRYLTETSLDDLARGRAQKRATLERRNAADAPDAARRRSAGRPARERREP